MTVRAPIVVVACGALESPALLKRSGIGGPAVGNYLRLHPAAAVFGLYGDDQQALLGAPQTGLVDEFADSGDGYGFLIEGVQYTPGLTGSALPWTSAEEHKELIANARRGASFITLTRDHGHGRVDVDQNGEAVPYYDVSDPVDDRHDPRGDRGLRPPAPRGRARCRWPIWRTACRCGGSATTSRRSSSGAAASRCARVGSSCSPPTRWAPAGWASDPQTSVANPWGELHDVKGVWIGDGSAFPTPSGTNPMIAIMALAHRTAEAIVGTPIGAQSTAVAAAK